MSALAPRSINDVFSEYCADLAASMAMVPASISMAGMKEISDGAVCDTYFLTTQLYRHLTYALKIPVMTNGLTREIESAKALRQAAHKALASVIQNRLFSAEQLTTLLQLKPTGGHAYLYFSIQFQEPSEYEPTLTALIKQLPRVLYEPTFHFDGLLIHLLADKNPAYLIEYLSKASGEEQEFFCSKVLSDTRFAKTLFIKAHPEAVRFVLGLVFKGDIHRLMALFCTENAAGDFLIHSMAGRATGNLIVVLEFLTPDQRHEVMSIRGWKSSTTFSLAMPAKLELVQRILELVPEAFFIRNDTGKTACHYPDLNACFGLTLPGLLQRLGERRFEILNTKDMYGRAPLFFMLHNGVGQVCEALGEGAIKPEEILIRDDAGCTIIHHLVAHSGYVLVDINSLLMAVFDQLGGQLGDLLTAVPSGVDEENGNFLAVLKRASHFRKSASYGFEINSSTLGFVEALLAESEGAFARSLACIDPMTLTKNLKLRLMEKLVFFLTIKATTFESARPLRFACEAIKAVEDGELEFSSDAFAQNTGTMALLLSKIGVVAVGPGESANAGAGMVPVEGNNTLEMVVLR